MVAFNKFSFIIVCLMLILAMKAHPAAAKNKYIRDFLTVHNRARAEVGVPPLTWNASLAGYARGYASVRSKDCALQHSKGPYGENIAEGGILSASHAVKLWVGEKPYYNPGTGECVGGQCGHYTQVVWRDTKSVGCARVRCTNNGWWFITCNYFPPGNYIGERPF